jgi:hypothetical protein
MTMGTVVVACLGRQGRRGGRGDDHIHLGAHQLGGEPGKLIRLALGEPALDDHGPPFDPAEVAQPLPEPVHVEPVVGFGSLVQIPDPPQLRGWLRATRDRRGEEADCDAGNECPPIHHSMT